MLTSAGFSTKKQFRIPNFVLITNDRMRHHRQPPLNCNLVVGMSRDPMSADEGHAVLALPIQWRNRMTKFKLVSAALIATALVAAPAMARENKAAVRQHTTATTVGDAGCIRAPAVGAFASEPWTVPPCEPTTVY
jgi:hypothetical protein